MGKTKRAWLGISITAVTFWLVGAIVAYSAASSGYEPPPPRSFLNICLSAVDGTNTAALIAAVASGIGMVASLVQLFGPKPYTEAQGKADRQHLNESFHAADRQEERRHEALMAAIEQLDAKVSASDPARAGPLREALNELAQSGVVRDREIAEAAIEDPVAAGDRLMAESADRARTAARIYAPFAPAKATAAYRAAVDADPGDVWSWIELGRLRRQYGSLAEARACFGAALQRVTNERDRAVLHVESGRLLLFERDLPAARSEYMLALAISRRLLSQDEKSLNVRNGLSAIHDSLGEIALASGALDEARDHFMAGLEIDRELASETESRSVWRNLAISHCHIGDVELELNNVIAANEHYQAGRKIAQTLLVEDPDNTNLLRSLSVVHHKLFRLAAAQDEPVEARKHCTADLGVAQRLVAQDPDNAEWQRDLFASHANLAQLDEAVGDVPAALSGYRAAEAIVAALVAKWQGHPGFEQDLVEIRRHIARLERSADAE